MRGWCCAANAEAYPRIITLALLASLKTKLLPEPKRDEARARTSLDIETQALLNLLADSIATAKVLLLVNYRPEYPTSS